MKKSSPDNWQNVQNINIALASRVSELFVKKTFLEKAMRVYKAWRPYWSMLKQIHDHTSLSPLSYYAHLDAYIKIKNYF